MTALAPLSELPALRANLSFEEWSQLGVRIRKHDTATRFALGDWVNYGDEHFGERSYQSADALGYDGSYLRNVSWVARNVPHDLRDYSLPFSVHQAVAVKELDYHDKRLLLAKAPDIARDKFRELVKQYVANKGLPEPETLRLSWKVGDTVEREVAALSAPADATEDCTGARNPAPVTFLRGSGPISDIPAAPPENGSQRRFDYVMPRDVYCRLLAVAESLNPPTDVEGLLAWALERWERALAK